MSDVNIDKLQQLAFENNDYHSLKQLVEIYESRIKKDPHDTDALIGLVKIHETYDKDYLKARDYYEKLLEVLPNDASLYYQYGSFVEFNLHDYELAKNMYLKAIELNPNHVNSYLNLSWLYLDRLDDVHTSYIIVQEALKSIEDSDIYAQLAYIEFRKYKEFKKAESNLRKALDLDNENDLAYTYLGQLYILEKRFDDAKSIFAEALEKKQVNDLLLHEYGKLLIVQYKDFEGTIKILEQAVELYPDKVIYYAYIANLYFVLGNNSESIRYLHLAESFEIKDQEALLLVGYLKVMLDDDKDEALMYFEKVIELNPTNLNALSFIGFYNLMNNQHIDTALGYFKKIADLSNDTFIVYFIIAQIYLQYYHDSTQALEYLLKIDLRRLNITERSYILFVIGNIYEKYVGNNHLALDYYEQAYQVKPDKFIEAVINQIYESDKTIVN